MHSSSHGGRRDSAEATAKAAGGQETKTGTAEEAKKGGCCVTLLGLDAHNIHPGKTGGLVEES